MNRPGICLGCGELIEDSCSYPEDGDARSRELRAECEGPLPHHTPTSQVSIPKSGSRSSTAAEKHGLHPLRQHGSDLIDNRSGWNILETAGVPADV